MMLRALLALLLFIVVGASQAMAHSQSYGFVNLTHSETECQARWRLPSAIST